MSWLQNPMVRKTILPLLALIVGVILLGMLNYALGGFGQQEVEDAADIETPAVRFESAPESAPLTMTGDVVLPWSDERGVAVGEDGMSSLESVFAGPDGRIYVVDHPRSHKGARVRWYEDGRLIGTHLAPPGSLFFRTDREGFAYLISKVAFSHERIVLVDRDGSVEATYTVPRKLNAGGIVRIGDELLVRAWASAADPKGREFEASELLVPVTRNGEQISDDDTGVENIEAWLIAADGTKWEHRMSGTIEPDGSLTDEHLAGMSGDLFRIPTTAYVMGLDGAGRLWLLYPPTSTRGRYVGGWPAVRDDRAMLVAVDSQGEIKGAMPVPLRAGLYMLDVDIVRNIGFDGSHLAVAEELADGVRITAYEVGR